MTDELVVLREYSNELAARMDAMALEANGIAATVSADIAGGVLPNLALSFPIRLIVRAADAEVALELLDTPVESTEEDDMEDAVEDARDDAPEDVPAE